MRAVDNVTIRTNVRIIHVGNSGIEGEGVRLGVGLGEGVGVVMVKKTVSDLPMFPAVSLA